MPVLKGWCPNGHAIEAFVAAEDLQRIGEEGVAAYMGVSDVTCNNCGELIDALAEK